jgi:hypothetical protein
VTLQEHKTILAFLDNVLGGSHEPLDLEADAIIRAYFKRNPDAAYRITRLAMSLARVTILEEPRVETRVPKRRRWLPALRHREA